MKSVVPGIVGKVTGGHVLDELIQHSQVAFTRRRDLGLIHGVLTIDIAKNGNGVLGFIPWNVDSDSRINSQ
jgi:hypothetical protein